MNCCGKHRINHPIQLFFVLAVVVNELLAAREARKKNISQPGMDHAKCCRAHGQNMNKALKLGQSISVTPSDAKALDAVKIKDAGELATRIPLDGKNS